MKPLSWYLVLTCLKTDIVSDFTLLLNACTDLKYIFFNFMCMKGVTFTKRKSMASSTLWLCLAPRGGKGILGMVLWYSGLLLMALYCIMGMWGPYMASALLVYSVVISQFLIWFFERIILGSVLMAILQALWVFLLCPILWCILCGSMTCCSILWRKIFSL